MKMLSINQIVILSYMLIVTCVQGRPSDEGIFGALDLSRIGAGLDLGKIPIAAVNPFLGSIAGDKGREDKKPNTDCKPADGTLAISPIDDTQAISPIDGTRAIGDPKTITCPKPDDKKSEAPAVKSVVKPDISVLSGDPKTITCPKPDDKKLEAPAVKPVVKPDISVLSGDPKIINCPKPDDIKHEAPALKPDISLMPGGSEICRTNGIADGVRLPEDPKTDNSLKPGDKKLEAPGVKPVGKPDISILTIDPLKTILPSGQESMKPKSVDATKISLPGGQEGFRPNPDALKPADQCRSGDSRITDKDEIISRICHAGSIKDLKRIMCEIAEKLKQYTQGVNASDVSEIFKAIEKKLEELDNE